VAPQIGKMTQNNIAVLMILRHDNEVVVDDDGIVVVIIMMEVEGRYCSVLAF
jgi:hypothetical protein